MDYLICAISCTDSIDCGRSESCFTAGSSKRHQISFKDNSFEKPEICSIIRNNTRQMFIFTHLMHFIQFSFSIQNIETNIIKIMIYIEKKLVLNRYFSFIRRIVWCILNMEYIGLL